MKTTGCRYRLNSVALDKVSPLGKKSIYLILVNSVQQSNLDRVSFIKSENGRIQKPSFLP